MIIGIPKEIKNNEYRVAVTPFDANTLILSGHRVIIEYGAGLGSGFTDEMYEKMGVEIKCKEEVYSQCDILYKVKEIEESEFDLLHEGQVVFTYLHSNAHPEMTKELLERNIIGIAYEDVDDDCGEFPLLSPMSILAGKGGFLAALHFSQSVNGGKGLLLNRQIGCETPKITIIGCGYSGIGAAELASSFGNKVTMLDINKKAMEKAAINLPDNVEFLFSNRSNLLRCIKDCDVLINCILWPKTRKDHLVNKEDLKLMKSGALIIDVACDDEGAIETCHSTSHDSPVYCANGIMHYAVDNIPSAFAQTASIMLSNATISFVKQIADLGPEKAMLENPHLRRGLTTYYGKLCLLETAKKHNMKYTDAIEAITLRS